MVDCGVTPAAAGLNCSEKPRYQFTGTSLLIYAVTALQCILAVGFGHDYLLRSRAAPDLSRDVARAFSNWDGVVYKRIAEKGYAYDPKKRSSVAFFPAYPILGKRLATLADCSTEFGLLIASHFSLGAAFVLLAAYLHSRLPDQPQSVLAFTLLAFSLWPTTFFFRMAYSESLFLLLAILALYGIEKHWPLTFVAVLIGVATATRSVGVALLPCLLLAIWRRSPSRGRFVVHAAALIPLGCWGLACFMAYQWIAFGEPFAFVQSQENWRLRPPVSEGTQLMGLATLEPLWSVFDPSSPCYWGKGGLDPSPLLSLRAANPLYFAAAVLLLVLGTQRRWLNSYEIILSTGLLLIPYLTRSFDMCFCSMGRFAAVAFPLYIVMGHLLAQLRLEVAGSLLAVSGFFMGVYAALFAAGYPLF